MKYLADKVSENAVDDDIFLELCVVYNADNVEQATALKEELERRFQFKNLWFMDVGPVIGCHCGPGTMAVLIMGKERTV